MNTNCFSNAFHPFAVVLLLNFTINGNGELLLDEFDNRAVKFNSKDLTVEITDKILLRIVSNKNKEKEIKLQGEIGVKVPQSAGDPVIELNDKLNIKWGSSLTLTVTPLDDDHCHNVAWTSLLDTSLEDCFDFGTANWFGGPEVVKQLWPIERLHFEELPYVTQSNQNMAVTEPYWLSSLGAYIYVNWSTPLFIDTNNHRLNTICLIANDVAPYMKRPKKVLDYTVCGFSGPRRAHEHAVSTFIGKPDGIPDKRMVQHPIWSTWVRYKTDVNETAVLQFANEIVRYGFNNSQIEIDDNWETCYGSTYFNTSRFPNMKELSGNLKKLGFRITIWVHPFVNLECPNHSKLRSKGYFVKNGAGSVDSVWWDGNASVVDVTSANAVKWFRKMHNKIMQENDIDGLKFDAGETSWLPQVPLLNCAQDDHPKAYSAAYVDAISEFSPLTELRVTHRTQKYPMFLRMIDRDSTWSLNNGLLSTITTMFVMNMQGYPWVLPDMVGGNAYNNDVIEKELFIRWLQLNTFMPSIQFSVPPWDLDFETVEISRKFTALHYRYSDKIIQLMEKTVRTGAPLNPPIWWIDPKNPTAHKIYSEYLLGEDILVAPIVKQGAVSRNIYLPKGYWRDENHPHKAYKGRRWLRNYHADLTTLPYFTRISRNEFKRIGSHLSSSNG